MRTQLLDHGWVEMIESWGSDEGIIAAARESTDKGFVSWEPYEGRPSGDMGLLRYLWRKRHTTPFETPGMTVRVCCPVVVVWHWVRHRTMSYNILSGRYSEMPDECYVPTLERLMKVSGANKQAGAAEGSPKLNDYDARGFLSFLASHQQRVMENYRWSLRVGVPKELARLFLGFGNYTRMRVTANLLNWTRFLALRLASDVQDETRVYAVEVARLLTEQFPRTMGLFNADAERS